MVYRRMLVCALGIALLSAAPGPALAATQSPKAVNLTASDVPHGFAQTRGVYVNNAAFAKQVKFPKAEFDKHGRITGYTVEFDSNATKGVVLVVGSTFAYKSVSGATWDYTNGLQHDLGIGKKTSAPLIGVASTGVVLTRSSGGKSYTFYLIDFHKGSFSVTVTTGGLTGQVKISDTAHYANIIASRIH